MTVKHIPVGKIIVKKNIRRDDDSDISGLMESIKEYDILQPILVKPEGGKYVLIAGHRRFRAVKASGEPFIPALVRDDIPEHILPLIQLSENVQRKQMKPWELVEIFEEMKKEDPKLTQRKLACKLGKSQTWVSFKYKAAKMYTKLIADGVPEEELEEMNEHQLVRLTKKKVSGTRSRNSQKKNKYEYKGGFEIIEMGKNKIMLSFRDPERMRKARILLNKLKGES